MTWELNLRICRICRSAHIVKTQMSNNQWLNYINCGGARPHKQFSLATLPCPSRLRKVSCRSPTFGKQYRHLRFESTTIRQQNNKSNSPRLELLVLPSTIWLWFDNCHGSIGGPGLSGLVAKNQTLTLRINRLGRRWGMGGLSRKRFLRVRTCNCNNFS